MLPPNQQTTPDASADKLPNKHLWQRLLLLTLFAAFFYVLMEWLFFVTKPSFMDLMTLWEKTDLLLTTGLILSLLSLLPVILLWGLSSLPGLRKISLPFVYAAAAVPALTLSITTLLLVDNFSYTLFQFGIVSTSGLTRIPYTLFVLVLFALFYRQVLRWLNPASQPKKIHALKLQTIIALALILLSASLTIPKLFSISQLEDGGLSATDIRRPNILLIGSDGLNASNTSVYGYERDTTPNLRHLADESLLAENAFTNSAKTSGSIISIFNSKLPTQTRVIYPPDILRNSDSYQHLPGILHKLGYRTIEISISHYIDAYTLNLRDGFDIVNDRSEDQAGFQIFSRFPAFQDFGYFFSVLVERVSDRLLHIFFIQEMSNPYQEVTTSQLPSLDRSRLRRFLTYLKEADKPVFIHLHLMGTHGESFLPRENIFSKGQTQDSPWMTDFYDDTVLEFDDYTGKVLSELSKLGILEDTIFVVYSDHAQNYQTDRGIPLMFRFPNGEFAGRIRNNAQNLDIAPTLLDYINVPIPQWMEGKSLLAGEPDPLRVLYSAGVSLAISDESGEWILNDSRITPPFYQFSYLQAIICQNWYRIDLIDFTWDQGEIAGHTAPCDAGQLADPKTVQSRMLERLKMDGFDTSTLLDYLSAQ